MEGDTLIFIDINPSRRRVTADFIHPLLVEEDGEEISKQNMNVPQRQRRVPEIEDGHPVVYIPSDSEDEFESESTLHVETHVTTPRKKSRVSASESSPAASSLSMEHKLFDTVCGLSSSLDKMVHIQQEMVHIQQEMVKTLKGISDKIDAVVKKKPTGKNQDEVGNKGFPVKTTSRGTEMTPTKKPDEVSEASKGSNIPKEDRGKNIEPAETTDEEELACNQEESSKKKENNTKKKKEIDKRPSEKRTRGRKKAEDNVVNGDTQPTRRAVKRKGKTGKY